MGMKNSTIQKRAIARALKSAKALEADLAKVESTVASAALTVLIMQLEALQGLKAEVKVSYFDETIRKVGR